MSLQVWLPLNKDLHNQGLQNTIFTNHSVTINNSGKIGKCYSFNGSSSYLIANFTPKTIVPNEMSFCCWVKLNTINKVHTLFCSRTKTGAGLCIFILSSNQLRFDNMGNTNSATYQTTFTPTFSANQWYHIAVIQTSTHKKLYIDGVLKQTVAKTPGSGSNTSSSNSATKATIGGSGANNATDNWLNGYLNDVRIYNHALSDKEVEEISKGLVLHYKLDGGPTFPPRNLLLNSKKDAGQSHTSYAVANFNFSEALVSGNHYTIIAKVNTSSQKKSVAFYHSGGSYQMGGWRPISSNGIYKVSFTATSNMASQTSGSGYGFCRVYTSNNSGKGQGSTTLSGTANVEWITLYWGSGEGIYAPAEEYDEICYDSSGYNNNGTIVGTQYAILPSDKYQSSMYINQNCYIAIGTQLYSMRDEMTTNLWINKTWSSNTGTPLSSVQGGGFGWQCNSTNYTFYCGTGASSNTYISKALTVNNLASGWHMLSATYDGLALRLYIDGVLQSTTTKYTTKTPLYYNNNSGMFIGRESNGNVNTSSTDKFYGYINDVRIYATALTEVQIKELYNTSATIDNLGNIHTREFYENSNFNITKTGLFQATEIKDGNYQIASILKNNNSIQGNNLYEY